MKVLALFRGHFGWPWYGFGQNDLKWALPAHLGKREGRGEANF